MSTGITQHRIRVRALLMLLAIALVSALAVHPAVGAWQNQRPLAAPAPLAHFYYMDDTAGWESLSANVHQIGLLSPVWFHVQEGGKLRITIDPRVRQFAVQSGVALMPVIVNEEFRLEAARSVFDDTRGQALIQTVVKLTVAENFQGLQLDFEDLEPIDREPYARLAEKLGAALRKHGKQLSVAVVSPLYAAVPASAKAETWIATGRSQAFDYERLAAASDFLSVMTYDQYTSPNAPGPVAGIGWMEACVRKLLETIPPSKLTLGLPLYHRHWAAGRVTTGSWMEAQEWSWKAKAGIVTDGLHEEPVLRFRSGAIDHEIWFQNAGSIRRRIQLAQQLGLRGFSAWRIGQEDPSVWTEGLSAWRETTREGRP